MRVYYDYDCVNGDDSRGDSGWWGEMVLFLKDDCVCCV